MSANLLSMGAVDFGVIVDGGVVIIEAILFRLGQAPHDSSDEQKTPTQRIREATLAVVKPTVFSLLIIIAAYLPIFMLERVEGRIFAPMANTVVAALVGALIFSVTLVPVLATFVYRTGTTHKESPVLRIAAKVYSRALQFALKRRILFVAGAAGLLALSALVLPRLGSEFLPELNEGALYMTFALPSNMSLTEGRKLVPKISALVSAQPQVAAVMSQLGRPEDGTDAKLANNLEFFIKLKHPDQWPKDTPSVARVIDVLQRAIAEIAGLEVNFSQPIRDNVNESISGQIGQIAVKLYSDDLEALQRQAEKVKDAISKVTGVADLGIVKSGQIPQIQIVPDRAALARHGLPLGQFQHFMQAAMAGQLLGDFWDGERRFDLVMRMPLSERNDVEKISKLQVPVDRGQMVNLEALAKVKTGLGRASINRENGRRYVGIRMNVRGRDLGGFVTEARASVLANAPLPPGMTMEWGGEFENKERAMNRLLTVVPVALLLTLLLLFKAFDSMGHAVVTLINVPFALVGGVFGLWLAHMPLSVAAAVGFIALIGQASLNGVLVMSAIAERRAAGASIQEAAYLGSLDRLRPVLMTAALAALGLVPAAMSHAMGSETQRPLAVVIVFGTVSACALTLLLLPVLYTFYATAVEHFATGEEAPLAREKA